MKTDFKNPEVRDVDNDVTGKTIFDDYNMEEISIFDDDNSVDLKGNGGQELGDADEQDQVGDREDSLPPTSSGSSSTNFIRELTIPTSRPGVSHYYGLKDFSRKIKNSGWAMLSTQLS